MSTSSTMRKVAAVVLALVAWFGLSRLAALVVPVPLGAYVFVLVLVVAMMICGIFLPLSGFGSGSGAIGISLIVASIVVVVLMDTPAVPLFIGLAVLSVAFTPAMFVLLAVMRDNGT